MKKNDIIELRKSDSKQLEKKLIELNKQLVETQLKLKKGEVSNLREPKMLRRSIAQTKTIMKEQKILESVQKETK